MTPKKQEKEKAVPTNSARRLNTHSLNKLQAHPVGVQVVRKGEAAPEPLDEPVEGAPAYTNPIKDPKDHQTIQDRLDYLCDALGGARVYRKPLDNGEVQLSVKLPDGTSLGGLGTTTAEAFNQLLDRVKRFMAADLHKEDK